MSENLFNFPGGGDESGENPFDLGGFAELTGSDAENPFADLLTEGRAASESHPAADPNAEPASQEQEEVPQPKQAGQTAEQVYRQDATASPVSEPPQPKTPSIPKTEDGGTDDDDTPEEDNPLMAAINRQEEKNAKKAAEPIFAQLPVYVLRTGDKRREAWKVTNMNIKDRQSDGLAVFLLLTFLLL